MTGFWIFLGLMLGSMMIAFGLIHLGESVDRVARALGKPAGKGSA